MEMIYAIIIVSFFISLMFTPLIIKFAKKFKFVDIPKDERKIHATPMPRIGGLAIVLGMSFVLFLYYLITKDIASIALNDKFFAYMVGAIVIVAMGFLDDIYNLRARYKFVFQLIAAFLVYYLGIRIEGVNLPIIYTEFIDFGVFALPITMLWIIAITNAVNLIDGLDGLAAGITSIASTALLIIFVASSASLEALVITAALVGSVIGFLPFNFNPAKTFMGDVGSNFLGYTLSVVSILGFAKGYTFIAILAPLLTLGVPIFDTLFAMIRRILAGKSPLTPDGAHVHHRLLNKGFNQRQSVLILYTITSVLCTVAVILILSDTYKAIFLVLITIIFILCLYIINFNNHSTKKIK